MYSLGLNRNFRARHYLIGGDWGAENEPHHHDYRLEVVLHGEELDAHGYLLDLVDLERHLEALLDRFRGSLLNDLPEFQGLNPSLEHFARVFARALASRLDAANLRRLEVRLWEDEEAWAAYRMDL